MKGIKPNDCSRCPLVIDDILIQGNHHYPCITKLRSGCKPIGEVGRNMRLDRYNYFVNHDTHKDEVCRKNCPDISVAHNNRTQLLNKKCFKKVK